MPTKDSFQISSNTETESEEQRKVFHANGNEKKAEVAILMSNKTDFKTKTVTRDEKMTLHKD